MAEAGQGTPEGGAVQRVTRCGKNHNCVFLTQLLSEGTLALPKLETQEPDILSPCLPLPFPPPSDLTSRKKVVKCWTIPLPPPPYASLHTHDTTRGEPRRPYMRSSKSCAVLTYQHISTIPHGPPTRLLEKVSCPVKPTAAGLRFCRSRVVGRGSQSAGHFCQGPFHTHQASPKTRGGGGRQYCYFLHPGPFSSGR